MLVPLQAGVDTQYGLGLAFVLLRDPPEYCSTALHGGMAAAPLLLPVKIWTLAMRYRWKLALYAKLVVPAHALAGIPRNQQ